MTNVRVTGDDRENRRRMDEEARRQVLRGKLLAEAEHSARRNATVAMRWADLFGIEVPQDLHAEIEQQRLACDKIIGSKVSSTVLASRALSASAYERVDDKVGRTRSRVHIHNHGNGRSTASISPLKAPYNRGRGGESDGEILSGGLETYVAGRRNKQDRLITEMKNELKAKDDEYVKSLKRQAEDIETILGAMGSQFRELQSALLEELDEIEQSFLQERRELLDGQKGEISNLFERRSTMEAQFMEAMQQRAEQYQQALETQRVQDAEEYSILKIRLETDIQNLEQHLEAMRATYQVREA